MRFNWKTASIVFGLASLLLVVSIILWIALWAVGNAPESVSDRPLVTDWMQAWGNIAGVFAGFAAAAAAAALILHEREQARVARITAQEEQERRYEEQKRRHAEQVTWYLREKGESDNNLRTPVDAGGNNVVYEPLPAEVSEAVLVIINNSDNCIYEAIASIPEFRDNYPYREHGYLAWRGLGTIPPGQTEIVMPMRGYRSPGSTATRYTSELPNNRSVEYLQFKDSAGSVWRRSGRGGLAEVSETDAGKFPDYSA